MANKASPLDGTEVVSITQKGIPVQVPARDIASAFQWGDIIDDDTTLTQADSGKAFLVIGDAEITIADDLRPNWNIALVPNDSRDNTSHTITIAFEGSGNTIGNVDTVKGVCAISLTPVANLFATAGAIE